MIHGHAMAILAGIFRPEHLQELTQKAAALNMLDITSIVSAVETLTQKMSGLPPDANNLAVHLSSTWQTFANIIRGRQTIPPEGLLSYLNNQN